MPAPETIVVAAYERLQRATHAACAQLRFFDSLTALALEVFALADIEWVVLETGIGGRVDATNVVTPALGILTHIECEHTDVLGATLSDIAREKAGIIKTGVPVISAAHPPAVAAVPSSKWCSRRPR